MTKKKNYQGNRAKKRKIHPKKQSQNRNPKLDDLEIKLKQNQFFIGQIGKKLQGLMFGFDSYVRMKNDDENLNNYIKEVVEGKKKETQEKSDVKSDGNTSKSS